MARKDIEAKAPSKFGGPAFFLSLFMLLFLGFYNLIMLPALWNREALISLLWFAAGSIMGAALSHFLIRGHLSVLVHEWSHAIISTLAGNKWKGMKVRGSSGHFQYSYTEDTEHLNAFIALAPYWLPFFTVPLIAVAWALFHDSHTKMVALIAIGFGLDFVGHVRDISPVQTDLTGIRGGYPVSCLYILGMNLTLTTILLAWVLRGPFGLNYLLYGLWTFVIHLVAYYQGR